MEWFDTLQKLVGAHGVSGQEGNICHVLRELVQPLVDECQTDALGNLICRQKGDGSKVMLAAHMDSVGLIVSHIEKEGFLRFGSIGGLPATAAYQQPVRFVNGVMGTVAVEQDKEGKSFRATDLYVDIGAADRAEAERMVSIGDTAAYAAPTVRTGRCVMSPYLDDRAGCLVLLMAMEALRGSDKNDLYFVFTAQEEVGLRGAKAAAYQIDPDYALAVDVTGADDVPEAVHNGNCALGKGAAIKLMDRSIICHPQMVALLDRLAEERKIPIQHDILRAGGTDAGAIHTAHMGVVTGGVSIPTRYIHSPTELAAVSDLTACADLITAFAESELPKI